MAINKTPETCSVPTGELRPDATADSDETERACTPELGQEEDDRLGASEMLKTFTSLGGMAINKTPETGSYFTGELASGATADSGETERACTPELGQEEDGRLGASEMLKTFMSLGGMAINRTPEADSHPTGELRPDAIPELDAKEEIIKPKYDQADDDHQGRSEVLGALTGSGGMAVKPKSSRVGSIPTKGLLPDAHAHPTERAGTCNTQQNLLADFRAEKLTCKDIDHLPRD